MPNISRIVSIGLSENDLKIHSLIFFGSAQSILLNYPVFINALHKIEFLLISCVQWNDDGFDICRSQLAVL